MDGWMIVSLHLWKLPVYFVEWCNGRGDKTPPSVPVSRQQQRVLWARGWQTVSGVLLKAQFIFLAVYAIVQRHNLTQVKRKRTFCPRVITFASAKAMQSSHMWSSWYIAIASSMRFCRKRDHDISLRAAQPRLLWIIKRVQVWYWDTALKVPHLVNSTVSP